MARRLKVFEARIGFYDTVVAVPSRAAAMRAWGVRQDLFQDGQARESDDAAAIAAATAAPGVVLRRAAGSQGAFERDPQAPSMPRAKIRTTAAPRTSARPPPPPDRSAVTKAEKALTRLETQEVERMTALEKRRRALEDRIRALRDDFAARRRKAEADLAAARKAWRRAGGREDERT